MTVLEIKRLDVNYTRLDLRVGIISGDMINNGVFNTGSEKVRTLRRARLTVLSFSKKPRIVGLILNDTSLQPITSAHRTIQQTG